MPKTFAEEFYNKFCFHINEAGTVYLFYKVGLYKKDKDCSIKYVQESKNKTARKDICKVRRNINRN